jgi:hypothetical protein
MISKIFRVAMVMICGIGAGAGFANGYIVLGLLDLAISGAAALELIIDIDEWGKRE